MKRFIRVTTLNTFIAFLFSFFKKKEKPFCVTYKLDGYSKCFYWVIISFIDSTGNWQRVYTNNPHWKREVCLPKGGFALLVAHPVSSEKCIKCELAQSLTTHDMEMHLSAKIVSRNKVIKDEGTGRVLLYLPESETLVRKK